MAPVEMVVEILLVAFGVVLALWYENLGSPRLRMSIAEPSDHDQRPGNIRARFIHLWVENNPRRLWLVPRQTAYACRGTITFLDDGGDVIAEDMPIKWDSNPEPLKYELDNKGELRTLPDPRFLHVSRRIAIPPGQSETLAVAVRVHGETEVYGWTPESYFRSWRHEDYRLPDGGISARVSIATGDRTFPDEFRIRNPENLSEFNIER
ncbi:MAG: hypothetical protein ACE5JI_05720 [Acidobacteriota bacterium]